MNKIKLLIVDDEPLAHKVLEDYGNKIDQIEVVGNCYDGISTLNFLNKNRVDAILLDIEMPDISGVELLDTLDNTAPKVIITTAYTKYAMQSFDYDQVVDYLHKPIRLTRFIKAIDRLKKVLLLEKEFNTSSLMQASDHLVPSHTDFMSLKDNKVIYKISFIDIKYIQSWGNYLKFFLVDQQIKIVRKTIKAVEAELPSGQFLRIHKSYIVNIKHIIAIEGNHIKLDDLRLPIGKSHLVNVKKTIVG